MSLVTDEQESSNPDKTSTKETRTLTDFQESFRRMRIAGVPIVAVTTPDPASALNLIVTGIPVADGGKTKPAVILWDIVRGLQAANDEAWDALMLILFDPATRKQLGQRAGQQVGRQDDQQKQEAACREIANAGAMKGNLVEVLQLAERLPRRAVLVISNAHLYLSGDGVTQGVWNLRDAFKADGRTLVLMAPDIRLPSEISQDALILDEALPTEAELSAIIKKTIAATGMGALDPFRLAKAVDATTGLSSFCCEQVVATSLIRNTDKRLDLDISACWDRKRRIIEQTRGLKVYRGNEGYDDIGGSENAKRYWKQYCDGEQPPRLVIFQDEIEKMFAGSGGDTSGVTQELLGKTLSYMEDMECTGLIFVGPPGSGKSAMAKAAGNLARVPTISMNIADMKGSLVGQSTENLSNALRVITAMSGGVKGRVVFISTCNAMAVLPAALIARYRLGVFFFDLPDAETRDAIWKIWLRKAGMDESQERPADTGWAPRDIKNCVENARQLRIPLMEAANYIVSVSQSSAGEIALLQREASGRYISAARPGAYQFLGDDDALPLRSTKPSGRLLTN